MIISQTVLLPEDAPPATPETGTALPVRKKKEQHYRIWSGD
jgi:hypothetical protein